jgi:DNA-binding transcriptional MerR regulator
MDHPAPGFPLQPSGRADSGEGDLCGERYGLEELLAVAGERLGEEITPRTVRLYATQGLIDRPGREGRSAIYGGRHLLQLLLIRSLARRGLSLTAIAPVVAGSDGELLSQLHQLDDPTAPDPSRRLSATRSNEQQQALAYLDALNSEESDPSDSSSALFSMLGAPVNSRSLTQKLRSRLLARSSGRSSAASSRWHRFSLAPGVELHLSDSASIPAPGSRREAWLQRLLDRLREQLNSDS